MTNILKSNLLSIGSVGRFRLRGPRDIQEANQADAVSEAMRDVIIATDESTGEEVFYKYLEKDTAGDWSILWAKSDNGIDNWTTASSDVLTERSTDTGNGHADPTVIQVARGDWRMWCDQKTAAGNWLTIGYATSADGETWSYVGTVIDVTTEAALSAYQSIHHPVVIMAGSTFHMFFTANDLGPTGGNGDIFHATSTNGASWTVAGPVLERGASGEPDDDYLRPSKPFMASTVWGSVYHMLYWGYDGANNTMMIATSPDLTTWTKRGVYRDVGVDSGDQFKASTTITRGDVVKVYVVNMDSSDANKSITHTFHIVTSQADQYGSVPKGFNEMQGIPAGGVVQLNTSSAADTIYYLQITTPAAALMRDVTGYYMWANISQTFAGGFKMALYDDTGSNVPGSLVAGSTSVELTSLTIPENNMFYDQIPLAGDPITLAAETKYWVAMWSANVFQYGRESGNTPAYNTLKTEAAAYTGTFPASATTTGGARRDHGQGVVMGETGHYTVKLAAAPSDVAIDTVSGTDVSAVINLALTGDWAHDGNQLYVTLGEQPEVSINNPGVTYVT